MSDELVAYRTEGRVAVITLNRPAKRNAINVALADQLTAAWQRFAEGEERVAVLTGGNDVFTVGADLADVPAELWRCIPGIGVGIEKPIVAAVAGWCIGGGVVLVEMCDLCVAAEGARFSYPEAKVGFSGGLVATLAARIPHKIAMEMMLLGEPMAAERAYQVGLVNRVVPAGELLSAALDYANRLADNAPMVMAMLKRFVGEVVAKGPSERAALARAQVDAVTASADFAEGKAAFAAKRKPDFKGK